MKRHYDTTIPISTGVKDELKELKPHPRESYESVITSMRNIIKAYDKAFGSLDTEETEAALNIARDEFANNMGEYDWGVYDVLFPKE